MKDQVWDRIDLASLAIEEAEGWDSLHTMQTNYPRDDNTGAILCPFPKCRFRHHDPRSMFRHVHFGPHGNSYRCDWDTWLAKLEET